MFPVEVYKTPQAKARYKELEKKGVLQVVEFAENGFPFKIRFGNVTGDELISALGLIQGTQIHIESLDENDHRPLMDLAPRPTELYLIRVEIIDKTPLLYIKRAQPLPTDRKKPRSSSR